MKKKNKQAESLFYEGTELYEQKKFEEASIKLNEALKINPKSEDIMYNLALVYLEQKKYNLIPDLIKGMIHADCSEIIAELEKFGIVVKKSKTEKSINNFKPLEEYPTSWLKWYTYVRIPLGVLVIINIIIKNMDSSIIIALISIVQLIAVVFLFFGLHKRRLWGWKLNWFVLSFETLISPLEYADTFTIYFILLIIPILGWFLPNYFYFKKRITLFS